MKFKHLLVSFLLATIALEVVLLMVTGVLFLDYDSQRKNDRQVKQIVWNSNKLVLLASELNNIAKEVGRLEPAQVRKDLIEVERDLKRTEPELQKHIKDRGQQQALDEAIFQLKKAISDSKYSIDQATSKKSYEERQAVRDNLEEALRPAIRTIISRCNYLTKRYEYAFEDKEDTDELETLKVWVYFAIACAGTTTACASIFILLFSIKRIQAIANNVLKFEEKKALSVPEKGTDEIAGLNQLFYEVAAEVSKAQTVRNEILDNSTEVICSINSNLEFTYVSKAAETQWGENADNFLGTPIAETVIEQDRSEFVEKLLQISSKAQESTTEIETITERADNSLRNTIWTCRWSPATNSIFAVVHDITDRKILEEEVKQSERRLRNLMDVLPVGIVLMNEEGEVEYSNGSLTTLIGVPSEQIKGKRVNLIVKLKESSSTLVANACAEFMKQPAETEAFASDGTNLPVEIMVTEVNVSGALKWLGMITDISDRLEVQRIRQQFVAIVSHDLRAPLSVIMNYLELSRTGIYGELNKKGNTRLELVLGSVKRLLTLVNDLLDLEKMEHGGLDVHPSKQVVDSLVDSVVEILKPLADEKQIELKHQPIDAYVVADEARVAQVIQNLLSNAIKFSPENSKIVVSELEEADFVKICVDDSGPGIPEEKRKLIFEKFQQLSHDDGKRGVGTGLGLSIAKHIVDKHGGKIGVEKSELGGSRFWFTLPAG